MKSHQMLPIDVLIQISVMDICKFHFYYDFSCTNHWYKPLQSIIWCRLCLQETLISYPMSEMISTRRFRSEKGVNYLDIKCGNLMVQKVTRVETDYVSMRIVFSVLIQGPVLTHWGWDKMAAIFQTTFSNAFSWMKTYKLWLRFHWSLFPRVQLTWFHCWFR